MTIPEGEVTQIEYNGSILWKKPSAYKNWARYSLEADGKTIYNNGLGYKLRTRVRSGGAEGEQSNGICTGFIPFKVGETLRISPALVTNMATTACINFSNGSFTNLGQSNQSGDGGVQYGICSGNQQYFVPTIIDGVSVLTLSANAPKASEINYVRITHIGYEEEDAKKIIITVNEEIK